MSHQIIEEMLKALRPVLRSHTRARQLLELYWSDKMAIIWTTQDVHRAANEVEAVLTEAEARDLLQDLSRHHNRQYGIKWSDVTEMIKEGVLGRPITKRELARFVHKDVITINRTQSKHR